MSLLSGESRGPARRVLPVTVLLLALSASAQAASVFTSVDLLGKHCPAGGDDRCAGGTSFTPAGGGTMNQNLPDVPAGTTAQSTLSHIDPALGAANSSNGNAISGVGFLQLSADASVSSSPPLGQGGLSLQSLSVIAQGGFTDRLVIDAPIAAMQGSFATVNSSLVVEGQLTTGAANVNANGGGIANANWRIAFQVANAFGGSITSFQPGFFGAESRTAAGTFPLGPALPATIPISFNITFGVPFDVRLSAAVVAVATMASGSAKPLTEGVSAASAAALFGNTIFWNGISSVTSGGQLIEGYTVTSTSGANFAQSLHPTVVPLPATAWCLLSGLGMLAVRRRRAGQMSA